MVPRGRESSAGPRPQVWLDIHGGMWIGEFEYPMYLSRGRQRVVVPHGAACRTAKCRGTGVGSGVARRLHVVGGSSATLFQTTDEYEGAFQYVKAVLSILKD